MVERVVDSGWMQQGAQGAQGAQGGAGRRRAAEGGGGGWARLVLLYRAAARREEVIDGGEVGDEVRVAAVRTATAAAHVIHHLIRTGLTVKIRAEVRV